MFKARPLASLLQQTLDEEVAIHTAILFTSSGALLAQASLRGSPARARVMAALAAGLWTNKHPPRDEESDSETRDTLQVELEHGKLLLQSIDVQHTLGLGDEDLLVALQGEPDVSLSLLQHRVRAVKDYIEHEAAQVAARAS